MLKRTNKSFTLHAELQQSVLFWRKAEFRHLSQQRKSTEIKNQEPESKELHCLNEDMTWGTFKMYFPFHTPGEKKKKKNYFLTLGMLIVGLSLKKTTHNNNKIHHHHQQQQQQQKPSINKLKGSYYRWKQPFYCKGYDINPGKKSWIFTITICH